MSKAAAMQDYEVRDLFRRSLAYTEIYGIVWELIVEGRRIGSVSREFLKAFESVGRVWRDKYIIGVSHGLRSSGRAMTLLPSNLMLLAAEMIIAVDVYNGIIQSTQPGSDEVNINSEIKDRLKLIVSKSLDVTSRCADILAELTERQPSSPSHSG
jgi:hypothetical protein